MTNPRHEPNKRVARHKACHLDESYAIYLLGMLGILLKWAVARPHWKWSNDTLHKIIGISPASSKLSKRYDFRDTQQMEPNGCSPILSGVNSSMKRISRGFKNQTETAKP